MENPMEEPGGLQSMGLLRVGHDFTFTFTFHFHALEKEMATHSSVLTWRIPGTGEPGGLPSMGSHRVGHDWSDLAVAVRQFINVWISYILAYYHLLYNYKLNIFIPNYLEKNFIILISIMPLTPYLFNRSFFMQTLVLCICFTSWKNWFLPNCPW